MFLYFSSLKTHIKTKHPVDFEKIFSKKLKEEVNVSEEASDSPIL